MSIEAEIIYDADEPVTEAGRRRPVELVAVSGPRDVRDRHHSDAPSRTMRHCRIGSPPGGSTLITSAPK